MKLSKNTQADIEAKNLTTQDSSIQLQGNVGGCPGDVGLQVIYFVTSVRHIVRELRQYGVSLWKSTE